MEPKVGPSGTQRAPKGMQRQAKLATWGQLGARRALVLSPLRETPPAVANGFGGMSAVCHYPGRNSIKKNLVQTHGARFLACPPCTFTSG